MTINAMEKALWQASMNPEDARSLRDDPDAYLSGFRLDDRERSLMAAWDIRGVVELGVNPMVLMMANAAVNGPAASAEYVAKVNTPKSQAPGK